MEPLFLLDLDHVSIDPPPPGPNERRAILRRRITWALAMFVAMATLGTLFAVIAS